MRRISRSAAAIAIAAQLSLVSSSAQAQPAGGTPSQASSDEAGVHFRRGIDLFKEADFRGALIEFRRANQIAPNFRVQYNLAQCYLEMQDYAGALRAFQAYLGEGKAQVPRDRRAQVEGEIKKLQSRVATVEITSNVAGAEVRVDDDVVGTTPLDKPVLVGSGRRRITVEKAGMPAAVKLIDVAGGDKVSVAMALNEASRANATAPATPPPATTPSTPPETHASPPPDAHAQDTAPPPAPPASSSSYVWLGWTITGALAVGTAVTGILAIKSKSDFDSSLDTFPGSASQQSDARSKTKTFALVSDCLGVATLVAGGLSLYFTLTSSKGEGTKASTAPQVKLGIAPQRLLLQGEF